MEGGVAGAVRVRIRAAIEQQAGHLALPAVGGDDENARPIRGSVVHVRPGGQEMPGGVDVPYAGREQHRREPAQIDLRHAADAVLIAIPAGDLHGPVPDARPRLDAGAPVDKESHDVGVALRHGPHQRRLSVSELGGVDVRAARDERSHDGHMTGARGNHERRLARGGPHVRIGAALQKAVDDRLIPVLAGQGQRRHAVVVAGSGAGPRAQEFFDQRFVVLVHRPVQRRGAVGLRRVDVHARPQQRRNLAPVLLFGRICQPMVAVGRRDAGEREEADQPTPCREIQGH